jgi:1-acyl-sn-glycerol-3-phosphate acyltransferase
MVLMSGWIAADALDRDGVVARTAGFMPAARPAGASKADEPREPAAPALPRRSAWRVRVFSRYFRRWMGKNFHAVRLSRSGRPPDLEGRPVVIILNHPSWWDPLMGVVLAELFAGYQHYAPIDARALAQYRVFEPLGFFGVEAGTTEGALAFLRTGAAILSRPGHALWVTAQGRFTDPRVRPVELRQGVGHLLRRLDDALVLPLAIEYPFWQERYPEALAHFGTPIEVRPGRARSVPEWMARIEAGLTQALDELAAAAQSQDPEKFEVLVGGKVGVGGVYDWWRRLKARLGGRRFAPGHAEAVGASAGGAP